MKLYHNFDTTLAASANSDFKFKRFAVLCNVQFASIVIGTL